MSSSAPQRRRPAPAPVPPFRPDPELIVNIEGDERAKRRAVKAARVAVAAADRAKAGAA